jgi:endonuclease V-like protein UPF0215 family
VGIDDGRFIPRTQGSVIVVGVVFRGGKFIDGVMHTHIEIDGLDATDKFIQMINNSPHHRQLRLIMLNGLTFAGFNLVDVKKLYVNTGLPVLVVTHDKPDLDAVHKALRNLRDSEERWKILLEAGEINEIHCKGTKIYLELAGFSLADAKRIIRLTSTRSCMPEPLRVAHLIASGISP